MATAHTLIVEPDDGRTLVLQILNAATKSIDLTIYELSDPQIMSALESAQARKVAVRVLYNWYSFSTQMQQTDITPVIQKLTQAGIQCQRAPQTFEDTHEKAFVIDGATAIVMSFNLTAEYFGTTRDFGIVTTVPQEVAEIDAVFQADWSNTAITPTVASLVWSPTNSRTKLTSMIARAQETLDVYCEEAEDPGTLEAMVAAAKRGVTVRFIAAVLSGEGKINANARGITTLQNGGVDAVCKTFLYIHAKSFLADRRRDGGVGTGGAAVRGAVHEPPPRPPPGPVRRAGHDRPHGRASLGEGAPEEGRLRVAIAFADLAGYARLTVERGDERGARRGGAVRGGCRTHAAAGRAGDQDARRRGDGRGLRRGRADGMGRRAASRASLAGDPPPRIGIH